MVLSTTANQPPKPLCTLVLAPPPFPNSVCQFRPSSIVTQLFSLSPPLRACCCGCFRVPSTYSVPNPFAAMLRLTTPSGVGSTHHVRKSRAVSKCHSLRPAKQKPTQPTGPHRRKATGKNQNSGAAKLQTRRGKAAGMFDFQRQTKGFTNALPERCGTTRHVQPSPPGANSAPAAELTLYTESCLGEQTAPGWQLSGQCKSDDGAADAVLWKDTKNPGSVRRADHREFLAGERTTWAYSKEVSVTRMFAIGSSVRTCTVWRPDAVPPPQYRPFLSVSPNPHPTASG